MEKPILNKVNTQVYRQFPEMIGKKPSVKSYAGSKYLLIYNGVAKTANGKSINRTVRVVADEIGKILKITTSR